MNLVDLEKFHPVKKTLDSNQLQIMVAATLWPPKNALGLIRAIREVVNKGFVNFLVNGTVILEVNTKWSATS